MKKKLKKRKKKKKKKKRKNNEHPFEEGIEETQSDEPAEAEKITFFVYEELLAFKRACKTLGCTKDDVYNMMYGNAKKLTDGARRSIYGE